MSTLQNAQDAWSQPDGTINEKAIAAVVAARQEGGWGRSLHDILTIARRNLLIEFRNPAEILVSTAFPISLFLVFTASFAKVVAPGESYSSYAQFLLPFTLVQGLIFGSVNVGSVFYNDLESGRDVRLRAMPIARLAAVGGRLVAAAVRILFQISGIVLVGHLVGFRFYSGTAQHHWFFSVADCFLYSLSPLLPFISPLGHSPQKPYWLSLNPWILPFTFFEYRLRPQRRLSRLGRWLCQP